MYAHARGETIRGKRRMIKNSRGCEDVHTRCIAMKHRSVKPTCASLGKKKKEVNGFLRSRFFPALPVFSPFRLYSCLVLDLLYSINRQSFLPVVIFGRNKMEEKTELASVFFFLFYFTFAQVPHE